MNKEIENIDVEKVVIHNLFRLAELSNIKTDTEYSDMLDIITSFNISSRYDDYKKDFSKKCTKEYTQLWIQNITKVREYICKML